MLLSTVNYRDGGIDSWAYFSDLVLLQLNRDITNDRYSHENPNEN